MNFQRKIELVQQGIRGISQADDEDTLMRAAALDRIDAFVIAEREAMSARVTAKITETMGADDAKAAS